MSKYKTWSIVEEFYGKEDKPLSHDNVIGFSSAKELDLKEFDYFSSMKVQDQDIIIPEENLKELEENGKTSFTYTLVYTVNMEKEDV